MSVVDGVQAYMRVQLIDSTYMQRHSAQILSAAVKVSLLTCTLLTQVCVCVCAVKELSG